MDIAARLPGQQSIETGHSGYFTAPEARLDPRLFTGQHFKPSVRQALLNKLYGFWKGRYNDSLTWSTVWVAGSGVSHQWHGDRGGVGDLDVLVGVDMARFIEANPEFQGIPEPMIAKRFNNEFNRLLQPGTKNWMGFEVTFYVNPGASDIRNIQPYAAYDLTHDTWTTPPIDLPEDWGPQYFPAEWHAAVGREVALGRSLVDRYNAAAQSHAMAAPGTPQGRNAEVALDAAAGAAAALYEDIHNGRKNAFAPSGSGYADYYNFRWQSHKRAGTEQALRAIHDGRSQAIEAANTEKYGMADLSAQRAILNASLAPHGKRGLL